MFPLSWIAGGWALGVGLAAWLEPSPRGPLLLAVGALALACVPSRLRALAIALAACAGGALSLAGDAAAGRRLAGPLELTLEGRVVGRVAGGIVIESARSHPGVTPPARILLREAPEEGARLDRALPGGWIRARVRLRPPQPLRNPGAPVAASWPGRLAAVGRLAHPALWVQLRPGQAGPGLEGLRERVARRLGAHGPGGALLAALSVGRREGLDSELRQAIARAGLGHLLAVSGLHLGLVAGGAFGLARWLLARSWRIAARSDTRRLALLVAWGLASAYAVLSGGAAPVQRAWVCLSLPALALLTGRAGRTRQALSAAVLLLLVRDPLALFSAGAQLSVAASAALCAELAAPRSSRGVSLLRASATAILATAPIAALHFPPASPLALLVNLVAVPWTALVLLPASLAAAALASLPETYTPSPLLAAAAWLGELSLAAVAWLDGLGMVRSGPAPAVLAIAGAGAIALGALRRRSTRSRVLGCVAVSTLLALAPPDAPEPEPPRLVVLDVGQGDAILVQGRRGAVLVDAGVALAEGPDRGRDVVLPALRALGVRRLDLLAVSHADLDHSGGAAAVLEGIPVGRVWLPAGASRDERFAPLRAAARRLGVPVEERGQGSPPERRGDLRIQPLWPPFEATSASGNDRSLVLQVAVAGRRVLLPGDLEAAGEQALLSSGVDVRSHVLLLPHHGSRTSSSARFLEAVSPRLALASAPCLGRFAMPHPEVSRRLAQRDIPLAWTGRDGALRVALDGALTLQGTGTPRTHCAAALWSDGH